MNISDNCIWIASFDIGKKNFCFYIEEINISELDKVKKIPLNDRYNENYTPTNIFNEELLKIFKNGKKILHKNNDLTHNTDLEKYFDINICYNMTELLDKYIDFWNKCSIILIEEQMTFKSSFGRCRFNPMATKLAQHCFSYFAINFGRTKQITIFPSYNKTIVLGAERIKETTKRGKIKWKTMGDRDRKKWAVTKVREIYEVRNDTESLDLFTNKPKKKGIISIKKDDLADVVIQLQAYKYMHFIDKCI